MDPPASEVPLWSRSAVALNVAALLFSLLALVITPIVLHFLWRHLTHKRYEFRRGRFFLLLFLLIFLLLLNLGLAISAVSIGMAVATPLIPQHVAAREDLHVYFLRLRKSFLVLSFLNILATNVCLAVSILFSMFAVTTTRELMFSNGLLTTAGIVFLVYAALFFGLGQAPR